MIKTFLATGAACLLAVGAARAECPRAEVPPATARPVKPASPNKPACLDAKGGCPGWEAYTYNDAIKAYNAQIAVYRPLAEAYVKGLNAYVKAASDYAQCEVKALQ
ncbi:hypothetical protein [Methylobacterium sp. J-090]|uniref:hypothetical protein n=1 Tax=Methylobacterium sp. J-090 TaxID=2836666 RepID=UPI001FB96564|nr:hypothetical protein [Methylobacterium sp. J-090]MCJ2083077.1 hypothetical protein [Methylobacterium sp. J-090]